LILASHFSHLPYVCAVKIIDSQRDPFGQAMLAYQQGDTSAVVQVYSDIAIDDVIPARYLFRSHEEMPAWEQLALAHCKGHTLDIGAGAGGHALWLQEQGQRVTAVDISPGAVEVMQTRGLKQAVHADFREMALTGYDTWLLLMNGIGLVGDLKGLNAFFELAKRNLPSHGQILLDSSDILYLYESEDMEPPSPDNRYHGIIGYQMSFGQAQGEPFQWLYLDFAKLNQHAKHFGFECELLTEGHHYEYLARLTLTDGQ